MSRQNSERTETLHYESRYDDDFERVVRAGLRVLAVFAVVFAVGSIGHAVLWSYQAARMYSANMVGLAVEWGIEAAGYFVGGAGACLMIIAAIAARRGLMWGFRVLPVAAAIVYVAAPLAMIASGLFANVVWVAKAITALEWLLMFLPFPGLVTWLAMRPSVRRTAAVEGV